MFRPDVKVGTEGNNEKDRVVLLKLKEQRNGSEEPHCLILLLSKPNMLYGFVNNYWPRVCFHRTHSTVKFRYLVCPLILMSQNDVIQSIEE